MSVVGPGIEQEGISGLPVYAHVPLPEVSVNDTGLDLPTFSLQRSERTRDNLVGHLFGGSLQLRPWAISLQVKLADAEEQLPVEDGPALFPFDRVRHLAIARSNVKAEFASRRLACLVHLCKPASELRWLGRGGHIHVDKL